MKVHQKTHGCLVVSLDFELYWGVRDVRTIESYKDNLLAVRQVVPALLNLFHEYDIHATWATVGFLFFQSREHLLSGLPEKLPHYTNYRLSPYNHLKEIGRDEKEDPFHYAASLIKLIASSANQEVASHTFSHYYCLEEGQDIETFRHDLQAAIDAAKRYQLKVDSLVFPRNQFNSKYLSVCNELGFQAYRGNESSWIYRPKSRADESVIRRAVRLLDAYVNISGHNCYSLDSASNELPLNIPSSRFLRPFSKKLRFLEPLRMRRILRDLEHAAKNGLIYHLWWHPHNFGANTDENLSFLKTIFDYYKTLKTTYGMESLNMGDLSRAVRNTTELDLPSLWPAPGGVRHHV